MIKIVQYLPLKEGSLVQKNPLSFVCSCSSYNLYIYLPIYIKSSLGYLQCVIRCKYLVNSCMHNVNAMKIDTQVQQIQVLLFGSFWIIIIIIFLAM